MHPSPHVSAAALLVALTLPAAAQQSADERPVNGAFTEMQATRGDTAFQLFCASCHDQAFHTGEQFRMSWVGRTLRDYFKTIKTTMPEDNPGGLTDDQYVRVIAYIMKLNGYAPGADSLPADTLALKRIRISEPPSHAARSP